jgi:hypothetical protein
MIDLARDGRRGAAPAALQPSTGSSASVAGKPGRVVCDRHDQLSVGGVGSVDHQNIASPSRVILYFSS